MPQFEETLRAAKDIGRRIMMILKIHLEEFDMQLGEFRPLVAIRPRDLAIPRGNFHRAYLPYRLQPVRHPLAQELDPNHFFIKIKVVCHKTCRAQDRAGEFLQDLLSRPPFLQGPLRANAMDRCRAFGDRETLRFDHVITERKLLPRIVKKRPSDLNNVRPVPKIGYRSFPTFRQSGRFRVKKKIGRASRDRGRCFV